MKADSKRLAKLEGLIEQIAQRLTSIENRLNNMENGTSWLSLATLILLKT